MNWALIFLMTAFSLTSLASTKYIQVLKDIKPTAATKIIYVQNNRVVSLQEIDRQQMFCKFENIRDSDRTISKTLTKGTIFKIDTSGFENWERYLSIRIWQKTGFFWDNGYYQYFSCDALNAGETILDSTLEHHLGKFLKFY